MELLYIWMEKHVGISDISLNFSNQYRFALNQKEKSLTVTPTESYTANFFSDNCTNVTGLIGANGTGKTSVLRYIIEHCTDGINSSAPKGSIIVFKNSKTFYYYSSIDIVLLGSLKPSSFEKVMDLEKFKSATTAVYLSNQFDPTSMYAEDYTRTKYGETKNVSTWYLLHSDYQTRTGKDAERKTVTFNEKLEAFASMEFMRMVKVLRWITKQSNRNPFPVDMPPYLNLKLNFNQEHQIKQDFIELSQRLSTYFDVGRSAKKLFLVRAFEAALYHFIEEGNFAIPSDIIYFYEEIYKYILDYLSTNEKGKSSEEDVIKKIELLFQSIKAKNKVPIFSDRLDKIERFLRQLEQFIFHTNSKVGSSGNILGISIKDVNLGLLTDLIDEYYNVEKIGEYADFYFSHNYFSQSSLSSGEYTFLSFFGRLNDLKFAKKKSILLLIDEAELTLHPQWQKMFISLLIDFISENFKQQKVQIILTSHSPFILSDLPPNCVILLKRIDGQTMLTNSLESRNETFGANIHELFTDSFFLQDGLIGEFARRKIENLINRVNLKNSYTNEEYNSFKKEIDIIGEPYVRFKLLEKVLKGMPDEQFDNVIVEREKELELIRKIRNDKNRN